MSLRDEMLEISERLAKRYKKYKDEDKNYMIDDDMLECVSIGGFLSDGGKCGDMNKGYKPYYDYLKYGNKPQQEEPIMIEDNYNNSNYEYTTQYSFEYEPYFSNNNYSIIFDHEVDTLDTIQAIEELYNEDNNVIEEDVDSNDVINIMNVLSNKVKEVKKHIIQYISNYRPIYNQYTGDIDTILVE